MAIALGLPDSARWLKLLRREIEQEWNKSLLNRVILVGLSTLDLSYVQLLTMNASSSMRCSTERHGMFSQIPKSIEYLVEQSTGYRSSPRHL